MRRFGAALLIVVTGACARLQAAEEDLPKELVGLFGRLDALGRDQVETATFVELRFEKGAVKAWLLDEADTGVRVLRDELLSWTYRKNAPTTVPASWRPQTVTLRETRPIDFESFCQGLAKTAAPGPDDMARRLRAPGPSYRLLVAHAAWKRGLSAQCLPILRKEPTYQEGFAAFEKAALTDLAWVQFLRGVNLLMFADRQLVLPHLDLVPRIAPEGAHAKQAKDLARHLVRLVAQEKARQKEPPKPLNLDQLTDEEKAECFVSQLPDVRAPQASQPGFIIFQAVIKDGEPAPNPVTMGLINLDAKALPALIKALRDDTPTRTVYHWRDFARSRLVWRVSDFAWHLIRVIAKKDFGYRRVVGFTFGVMKPEERQAVIREIENWYAKNKNRSPDERMMASFSSRRFEDWMSAGQYFLKKKDKRAVKPLLEELDVAGAFRQGDLSELIGAFADPAAREPLRRVLSKGKEPSGGMGAAIGLWLLGDDAGIPVAIEFLKAEKQPYGNWEEPIWFLMWTRDSRAMAALQHAVTKGPPQRALEILHIMKGAITGDLWGETRAPAGSVALAAVLVSGMDRTDAESGTASGVRLRVKDAAAEAFVILRDGVGDGPGGVFAQPNPEVFNVREADANKRDAQILALKAWHTKHQNRLVWDRKGRRLTLRPSPP